MLTPSTCQYYLRIKTCANVTGNKEKKQNALQIAASAYSSLSSVGLRADSFTYTSMINVMANLIEDPVEKIRAINGIFQHCCNEGRLCQHTVNNLSTLLSDEEFAEVVGFSFNDGPPKIKDLPSEWSHQATSLQY